MVTYSINSKASGISTEIYNQVQPKVGGEDKGPTPLHAILGTVAACKSITAFAAAKSMGLHVEEIITLKQKVEERCPIYNQFKAANVKMIQNWEII
ncbi:putative OsmC-like protein [Bacillus mesophilus]|uniref:OsmC family protein n=1 Tax=Bacillus mesophilus TaxID=1808955 RepID=A0A6M0Q3W0_9BACI|nr:hypothetical protein [Bacillus mesophilus]MBM7659579.1 putative OsmC-like protein [Bacillus mesophilus]NEY70449.1 hypothetical protein [Bacillus mesophilus]